MDVELRSVGDIKPFESNPRKNDAAVAAVARSIEAYGFRQRIILEDVEMAEATVPIADAIREHGKESPECLAAVEAAEPIFEQGMERYKQKQAEETARKEAR